MKPNGYKKILPQIMPNKRLAYSALGLGLSLFWTLAVGDEILRHISDETEPKPALHSPEDNANSDRKIIYRVICSPEDEPLPDCEKPFHDVESVSQPQAEEAAAEQSQEVDASESGTGDQSVKPAPAAKTPQKSTVAAKKQADSKKTKPVTKNSANKTKTSAKKTATKPTAKKAPAKKK